MVDGTIIAGIEIDEKTASSGFKKLDKEFERSAKDASKSFNDNFSGRVGSAIGGLTTKILALGSAIAGAFTLSKAIKEAYQQDVAVRQLNATFAQTGIYSKQASEGFQEFANQLQATTNYSDDFILQNAATLQSLAQLNEKGLKEATKAALDLASTGLVDASTAMTMLGKAAQGEVASFTRYGISIKKGSTDAETFANTLESLRKRFDGLSEKTANPFTQFGNSLSDLLKSIGQIIIDSPALRGVMKYLLETFNKISDSIKQVSKGQDFFMPLINGLLSIGKVIEFAVIRPIEILWNVFNLVFNSIAMTLQSVVVAFAKVAEGVVFVGNKFNLFSDETLESFKNFSSSSLDVFGQFQTGAKESLLGIFDYKFSDKFALEIENISIAASNGTATISEFINSTGDKVKTFEEQLVELGAAVSKVLQQGIMKTLSTTLSSIGRSLVQGGSAFGDFKKMVLNILGDLAIQIGTLMIALAIGIEQLKVALANWTTVGLLAAGAALIIIGGALKGLGDVTSSPMGEGGGIASSGGSASSDESSRMPDVAEKTNVINLSVTGSIFGMDSKDTAQAIAQLLNDNFDREGVSVVRA